MWGKTMIPMYRLYDNTAYIDYADFDVRAGERPLNCGRVSCLVSLSVCLLSPSVCLSVSAIIYIRLSSVSLSLSLSVSAIIYIRLSSVSLSVCICDYIYISVFCLPLSISACLSVSAIIYICIYVYIYIHTHPSMKYDNYSAFSALLGQMLNLPTYIRHEDMREGLATSNECQKASSVMAGVTYAALVPSGSLQRSRGKKKKRVISLLDFQEKR